MAVTLSFHGGVREVTGSNFLLETSHAKILIDCGLHQGCHFCEGRNRKPFLYDPKTIDAVVATHSHIDHIGLLPRLVREGFSGKIYATKPVKDFAELFLEDSARLIGEEAAARNEKPPYEERDVAPTVERFSPLEYRECTDIAPGVAVTLYDAGHILGSAIAVIEADGQKIVCSGDLGNPPTPLLRPPERIAEADYVLIESTYGDRIHEDRSQRRQILQEAVERTIREKGTLLIPAFAMERTQEILAELNTLFEQKRIPETPVFVDSPLAIKTTAVYQHYPSYYNDAARAEIERGDIPFRFPGVQFMQTAEESRKINDISPPKVIISGSGMMQGGRVLHHARRYLRDPRSAILIIGYQAAGSLGRRLLARALSVRIFDEEVPVRARVTAIGAYSAHADQAGLLLWLGAFTHKPKRVFVVHGEAAASVALRQEIREQLGVDAVVPQQDERFILA